MDHYREFLCKVRFYDFGDAHIMIADDLTPRLKKYVKSFHERKFKESEYHMYFVVIKQTTVGFITYWNETINKVIIVADRYKNAMNKEKLLMLLEKSINTHKRMQMNFCNNILPVQTEEEQHICDQIETLYNEHMEKFNELRVRILKLDKQEKVDEFCKTHFEIGVKNKAAIFEFTQNFVSSLFDFYSDRLKVGLEVIYLRARNNLKNLQEEYEDHVSNLFLDLYSKNQELLHVSRLERQQSLEVIELNQEIHAIKQEITDYKESVNLQVLRKETYHWKKELDQFMKIKEILKKLKTELENVLRQEETYNSMKCTELPGERRICWEHMEKNIKERKDLLMEKISNNQKSYMTFFSLKQVYNRMVYGPNPIGPYILCEYGHQVYVFDYGLNYCHLSCDGQLNLCLPKNKYYYDTYGRYLIDDNNEKVYKLAPCTSCHKLGADMLLHKVTKDCGHSEANVKTCMMEFQDKAEEEILPDIESIDIKRTLDAETVKYLWDSFGGILYEALNDVVAAEPRNPIHVLAHKLLLHKYKRTAAELRQLKKESNDYRANIYQKRKDIAVAASKAYEAKQVRRRKPEESEDTNDWLTYNSHLHGHEFINSLDYYN